MLVHSYLYYRMDISLISDNKWQQWADELASLQVDFDDPIGFYDDVFLDWDGSTGYHLPQDEWVQRSAERLLRYERSLFDDLI